jgi:chitin disaccharide deacetylase
MSELGRLDRPERRGIIVTASDAGLCYSVNEGIRRARADGAVAGASLLVVAPLAREAVRRLGADLGVQLALSSEHELLDLRPISPSSSLLGGRGGFPTSAADATEHADPAEVDREFRAQIERGRALGVEPAFLSTHDDVVARQLALFDVFLDLAEEYRLPIRHGYDFGPIGLDAAALARQRGHFVADATINWPTADTDTVEELLASLPEGVSEVIVSPAVPGDELTAVLADAERRVSTLRALAGLSAASAARHGVAWLTWAEVARVRDR